MSQFEQPQFGQPMHQEPAKRNENGLGLTGFIISLVGIFLCGIPSIIGLIVSAFGLKKEPKGFAVAGLLLGLLGVIELLGVGFLAYQTYRLANQAGGLIREQLATQQLNAEAITIGYEWQESGNIPSQEKGDELVLGKRDIYGNSIVYQSDGSSFSLRSAGPDEMLETDDDIIVGPFESADQAIEESQNLDFEMDETDFDFE